MARPSPLLLPAAAITAALAFAAPARAQIQSMPMPPSASDPAPAEHATPRARPHASNHASKKAARHRKPLTAARGTDDGGFAPAAPARTAPGRAESPDMQLEDDPRVTPQLSPSGRPGVGVKF